MIRSLIGWGLIAALAFGGYLENKGARASAHVPSATIQTFLER